MTRKYGWKPDLPDHRDHVYAAAFPLRPVPPHIDLRPQCPSVYDQGALGSCTANAIGAAIECKLIQRHSNAFMPSRLFIYYQERAMEGTIGFDAGAMIRDGIKAVAAKGVCPESLWPYSDANPGPFETKPSQAAYTEAAKHRFPSYKRVTRNLRNMRSCLVEGHPFVFGITVFESFESDAVAQTGIVQMPDQTEAMLGGHAVLAVGYDDPSQRIIARNSWGPSWGMSGYFTIPYAYLLDENLSDDFWAIV